MALAAPISSFFMCRTQPIEVTHGNGGDGADPVGQIFAASNDPRIHEYR
jgi:hypothetical protein